MRVILRTGLAMAIVGWAGISLITGRVWARAVGIVVAALSAIANFLWLPYYPVLSIILIGLAITVIWALTRYEPAALKSPPVLRR